MESIFFKKSKYQVILVGAGPANLMAASFLALAGKSVVLIDKNSQIGKKWTVAAKSGLNIGMDLPFSEFVKHYYRDQKWVQPILERFPPEEQYDFLNKNLDLGITVGSAGKIFPEQKGNVFLKNWKKFLIQNGVEIVTNCQWVSSKGKTHTFQIKNQRIDLESKEIVFGMGGSSWKTTGSDGGWIQEMEKLGVKIQPFQPSNVGVVTDIDPFILEKFNGQFLKNCRLLVDDQIFSGEIRITKNGLEGSPIYHANHIIREKVGNKENFEIYMDWKPSFTREALEEKWINKKSLSSQIQRLKISPIFTSFFFPFKNSGKSPIELIKKYPIKVKGFQDMDRAISTIGGVCKESLNSSLQHPETDYYFNGEMVDWDAPTGGYLFTMCFAMGKVIADDILSKI